MKNDAIIYARLSREDEDKLDGKLESRSIENQIKLLTDYANEHRFNVVKVLYDDGYSGGNMDRPAFNELLKKITTKSFNVLLVKDFSRLGRVMYAVGDFVDNILPSHGIRLISVDDKFDSNDPKNDNEMSAVIKYFMNEYNLKDFKRKCRDARIHYANTKHLNYYPKFGYNFDENRNEVIDEFSAAIVRRAFHLIDRFNYSTSKVAEIYNQENIPTRSFYAVYVLGLKPLNKNPSKQWTGQKIWEIVKDYEYCGHSLNWTRHKKEEQILLKNTHKAIIDEDLYWRVQAIINEHSKRKRKLEHIGRLIFDRRTNRHLLYHKGKNVEYSAMYYLRENNIQTYSIRARMLEDVLYYDVLEVIESCSRDERKFYDFYKKKIFADKDVDVSKLKNDLEKINHEYSKLLESFFSGKIIEDVYKKKSQVLKGRIAEIENLISEMNEAEIKLELFDLKFKKFLSQLKSAPRDKLTLIQTVISKVYINRIINKKELDLTIIYKIEEF